MIVCIVIRRVKYMFRFILYLIKFLLPLYFSSYVHGFTPYAGPNWRESRGFIPAVPLKNVYITSNRGYSLSNSYIRRNPPLLSLADYAMDRKRGLGPNSSRRWGKRLEREMKHSYGNVAGNEDVGGCNPDYKFAETYFEDDEIGQWPPQEVTTHTGSLIIHLKNKNGGPYGSYKSLQGEWRLVNSPISLIFDRIQSDPFAPPSSIRLRVPNSIHRFPDDVITDKLRNVAACDAITRKICDELKVLSSKAKYGSDRKHFQMMNPSQYVLPRKTVVLTDRYLEARMFAHMPANGRRINGTLAVYMFNEILPALVRNAMNYSAYDSKQFYEHIHSVEDQEALRAQLDALGLVAFVGNGSILPRASGVSEMPLKGPGVQPFESPASLQISVTLPNKGTITGLGLKRGVNLIVGGGYHGKTTLLEALQVGCYNKVPGDGREFVVTSRNAVKVRAEDGRSVGSIDISTFIGTLPSGKDCSCFSTTDASGSTSQAAVIMESIEMGADLLLIDEDISATNFMYRDHMMDSLVSSNCEPITTFLLLVQAFYQKLGVSTILVSGACGLFMDQADTVIQMNQYKCLDKTEEAKLVVSQHNVNLKEAIDKAVDNCSLFKTLSLNNRVLSYTTFKRPSEKVRHHGIGTIQYGTENIDLSLVEQLVEVGQTSAITNILIYLEQLYREKRDAVHNKTLREVLELLYSKWDKDGNSPGYNGLDDINGFRHYPAGDCSMPRVFEVAAAINRMRSLKVADFKQQQFTPQQY